MSVYRSILAGSVAAALLLCVTLLLGCTQTPVSSPAYAATPAVANKPGTPELVYDRHYREWVNDQRLGHSRLRMRTVNGQIMTTYEEHTVEAHGGQPLEATLTTHWVETREHQPITFRVEQSTGTERTTRTYHFRSDHIELISEQADREQSARLPLPQGDWLAPGAFEAALRKAMQLGKQRIELRTWDPTLSEQIYTVTYSNPQLLENDEAPWPNAEPLANTDSIDKLIRWTVQYSYLPGIVTHEIYDQGLTPLGYRVDVGGGVVFRSSLAHASAADEAFDPPEMSGRSLITPSRAIDQLNTVRRAVYELAFEGDGQLLDLPPTAGSQRTTKSGERSVLIVIDLDRPAPTSEADQPTDEHLAASLMIDHADPAVRALVDKLVADLGGDPSARQYREACEQYVFRHLNKQTLAVGQGSASEAARTRAGDCTEASVLLAAMLRARGIPSRCVIGLAYTEEKFLRQSDVFVLHQWTQAWQQGEGQTPGRWIDLDAALLGYRAGHIALGVTAMGPEAEAQSIRLAPMMNGLSVNVVEIHR